MVTMNTHERHPFFRDPSLVENCLALLLSLAGTSLHQVVAYCFMPDHLHLLLQGTSEIADLAPFLKKFKQITGYRFKQAAGGQLWHRSYHDHVLRREEDIAEVAAYIWNNPVRAGLAEICESYPYSGPRGAFLDRPEGLSLRVSAPRVSAPRVSTPRVSTLRASTQAHRAEAE